MGRCPSECVRCLRRMSDVRWVSDGCPTSDARWRSMVAMRMGLGMWIRGMRPRTLPLAAAPVAASALSMWQVLVGETQGGAMDHLPCPVWGGRPAVDWNGEYGPCVTSFGWYAAVSLLCLGVALFLQIAANFANDYSDGVRGADAGRGGDGAGPAAGPAAPPRLVASGVAPWKVLAAAGVSALLACVCGLAVTALTGHWWFIGLGVVCLLAGWCYVGGRHPYGYHGFGEAAVFVFFGLAATCGTAYALCDDVHVITLWTACALGMVAVGVLSVNNLRDVESDARHGKRTWMVRLGVERGAEFTRWMQVLPVVMLGLSFVAHNPLFRLVWLVLFPSCGWRFDGADDMTGHAACVTAGLGDAAMCLAATAACAASVLLSVRATRATRAADYAAALPLTSLLSPALALSFGLLYLTTT